MSCVVFTFVFTFLVVGFSATSTVERKSSYEICGLSQCVVDRNETCLSLPVSVRTRPRDPTCIRNDFVCSGPKRLAVDVSRMRPSEILTVTERFDISRVYRFALIYDVYRWKAVRNPTWWPSRRSLQTFSFRPSHHAGELFVMMSGHHDWHRRNCLILRVLSKSEIATSSTTTTRTMTAATTTTTTTLSTGTTTTSTTKTTTTATTTTTTFYTTVSTTKISSDSLKLIFAVLSFTALFLIVGCVFVHRIRRQRRIGESANRRGILLGAVEKRQRQQRQQQQQQQRQQLIDLPEEPDGEEEEELNEPVVTIHSRLRAVTFSSPSRASPPPPPETIGTVDDYSQSLSTMADIIGLSDTPHSTPVVRRGGYGLRDTPSRRLSSFNAAVIDHEEL